MREMINYRDYLIKELSDPEEAIVYLEVSKEEYQKDGDAVAFLLGLKSIAEAQAKNNELASQHSQERPSCKPARTNQSSIKFPAAVSVELRRCDLTVVSFLQEEKECFTHVEKED